MAHKYTMIAAATLLGMLALATTAQAAEPVDSAAAQPALQEAEKTSRELAKQANLDAAQQAMQSARTDTKLDLDIKLIGPTSVKIASKR